MRAFIWLIGAAAASIGAALLLKKKQGKDADQLGSEFLAAVREGRVKDVHDHPEVGGGQRIRVIAGYIDVKEQGFVLLMRTDKNDAERKYGLVWKTRGVAKVVWNPLKNDANPPLHEAYTILCRMCSKGANAPN